MTQHPRFPSHRFWTALKSTGTLQRATAFVGVALLLSLTIAPAVLASYKPRKSSRPSGSTIGTVVRGGGSCESGTKGKLTALAPLEQVGQTTSTHPTFAWYVPDAQSYPIEFHLDGYSSDGKRIKLKQQLKSNEKGIMQYPLPIDQPGLAVGQTYRWKVALVCNPNRRAQDQILRAEIEVVAMPTALKASLAKTSDHLQRANLYAESGFWYDALAEALVDAKTKPLVITLLEDLVALEAAGTTDQAKQQHEQLKQVVEIEQR